MLFFNGLFLLYTALIVPVQICLWDYSDPCNKFPTLEIDLLVDTFFLVGKLGLWSPLASIDLQRCP
jgi:hypothetical protein